MFDFNGDGKFDAFDAFVINELSKDSDADSSRQTSGQSSGGFSAFLKIILILLALFWLGGGLK